MTQARLGIFDTPVATPATQQTAGVLVQDIDPITKADIEQAMPSHLKIAVTDSLVDKLNQISLDPDISKNIRDNFVSYTHVLKDGKFKIEDYMNAAAYVTYKMMGMNNQESYAKTFPDRYTKMVADNKDAKHISSFVSAYNKNKLVNMIMEQTLIAPWVLNQDLFQQALYVQSDLMINASSEKVRCEAANSILNTLKRPETSKVSIDIEVKDTSGITELKELITQAAESQRDAIRGGETTKTIAHQPLHVAEG